MQYSGRECDVSPYTDAYEAIKSVLIATAGTAWTSTETDETYILTYLCSMKDFGWEIRWNTPC